MMGGNAKDNNDAQCGFVNLDDIGGSGRVEPSKTCTAGAWAPGSEQALTRRPSRTLGYRFTRSSVRTLMEVWIIICHSAGRLFMLL